MVIADQAVSSLTNVAMGICAARELSTTLFGSYSVGFLVYVVALGIGRSLSSDYLVVHAPRLAPDARKEMARGAAATNLAVGLGLGSLLLAPAILIGGPTGRCLGTLAVGLPLMLLQDLCRYVLVADARPGTAIVLDGAWLAIVVAAVVALTLHSGSRPELYLGAWCAGGAAAGLGGCLVAKVVPDPRVAGTFVQQAWDQSRAYAMDFIVYTVGAQMSILLLALPLGTEGIAAVQGAQTLTGPLTVLSTGATTGLIAEGSRLHQSSGHRTRHRMFQASVALSAVAIAWGVGAVLLPQSVGVRVLGATWSDARPVLPLIALVSLASTIGSGAFAGLRIWDRADLALRVRVVSAPLTLALAVAAAYAAGPVGAAAGLAVGNLVGATLLIREFLSTTGDEATVSVTRLPVA